MPPARHLARHRLADLFLDTLPCNAHTTASDALWTGLPLLTCLGESLAGRVAASLVRAAGVPELVTADLGQYEALALLLAREPEKLREVRSRLSRDRDTCALFDTARFTRASKQPTRRCGRRGSAARGRKALQSRRQAETSRSVSP